MKEKFKNEMFKMLTIENRNAWIEMGRAFVKEYHEIDERIVNRDGTEEALEEMDMEAQKLCDWAEICEKMVDMLDFAKTYF